MKTIKIAFLALVASVAGSPIVLDSMSTSGPGWPGDHSDFKHDEMQQDGPEDMPKGAPENAPKAGPKQDGSDHPGFKDAGMTREEVERGKADREALPEDAPKEYDGSDHPGFQDTGMTREEVERGKIDNEIHYCRDRNAWALTFDDGPSEYTPKLLDLLRDSGVKATFFLVGSRIEQYRDVVERMVKEGHQVASHTWSHPHLPELGEAELDAEISKTQEAIKSATGRLPRFIRPPYGETDQKTLAAFDKYSVTPVLWSVDTMDWANTDGILKVVEDSAQQGAMIVLQHDLYLKSVEAEPQIIEKIKQQGYKLVTVAQCLGMSAFQ